MSGPEFIPALHYFIDLPLRHMRLIYDEMHAQQRERFVLVPCCGFGIALSIIVDWDRVENGRDIYLMLLRRYGSRLAHQRPAWIVKYSAI
jgi:hypothetical protein